MPINFREKLLLAKKEVSYGTDIVPTGGANAMLTSGLKVTPLNGDAVERNLDKPFLGKDGAIHVGVHLLTEFGVEIAGAGGAGDVPAFEALLQACGLGETNNVGVSQVYDPVSDSVASATLYHHLGGQKHGMVGARGNVRMEFSPREIPHFMFSMTGLWQAPASESDPTADWSNFQTPLALTNDNTPTMTLHGTALTMVSLTLDLGNTVTYRNLVGQESVEITERAGTGKVVFEAPAISVKDWFTIAKANTTGALQLVHGVTAGNIVQVDAPTVQLLNPSYGETDGVRTIEADLRLIPSDAGNDELKITVK